MTAALEAAAAAIAKSKSAGGRAVVLCDSPGGASAGAIAAYYLMRHCGFSLRRALDALAAAKCASVRTS